MAGPGFVNLTLSDDWHRAAMASVLDAGERFGSGGAEPPERILLEFVSANPTGPVVAANGQSAAYGDSLARILQHHGHDVQREYYVNDAGSQIARFGESVIARANGTEVPEGGYQGEYVAELAAQIPDAGSLAPAEAGDRAVQLLLVTIRETLERYGVHYDQFFSERTLHEGSPSYVERALQRVAEGKHSYESDGALWLRSTTFGDEKDRVLRRSDGELTYLASDVGYLLEKLERGYDRQIIPVGADHHGYVQADAGGAGGAGRRPGSAGDAAAAVRAPRRGLRARGVLQAPRRLHHARRADRRDRRRCHAVLHAAALARSDRRPRSGAGEQGVRGEPGLLRPVRARPDRDDARPAASPRGSTRPSAAAPTGGRWRSSPPSAS